MNEEEIRRENHKVLKWAWMEEEEFFDRYFGDATEQEIKEFMDTFPDFMKGK